MLDGAENSGRACIDELPDVLASWRALLAREAAQLDRDKILGLFGELHVVGRLADRDPQCALQVWTGPAGAPHDFGDRNALEVKTLSGGGAPSVTIHGATQLDPPSGGSLHLLALRVEESGTGLTLSEAVRMLAAKGVSEYAVLERTGPLPADESCPRLTITESRLFEVGDDFPGIRRSQLTENQRRGMTDLKYSLQLDSCPDELSVSELDRVLREL